MNVTDAIAVLDKKVTNPGEGLPDEVFYYISKTTPLVNVDLLIKDENNRTLLSWRNDQFSGVGWHVPGGIIRFKETFEQRIQKVAQLEIGVSSIKFNPVPLTLNEIILGDCDIRGHFISILYHCFLPSMFVPENNGVSRNDAGYLEWHQSCPDNLLPLQDIYRKFI